jgi:hypothetical protein
MTPLAGGLVVANISDASDVLILKLDSSIIFLWKAGRWPTTPSDIITHKTNIHESVLFKIACFYEIKHNMDTNRIMDYTVTVK